MLQDEEELSEFELRGACWAPKAEQTLGAGERVGRRPNRSPR